MSDSRDPIKVNLMEGRNLMNCEVPYARKDEFKTNVPLADWDDSTKTWKVPLAYLPEVHGMYNVDIEKEVAKKYNKIYDKDRKRISEVPDIDAELYPFQKIAVGEMLRKKNFLLALDMGLGKCFERSTTFLTNKGRFKAFKVFEKFAEDKENVDEDGGEYWSVREDLKIASLEENGEIKWRKPDQIYREKYKGKLRKITLSNGTEITITFTHPLLTTNGWTNDVEEGDKVAIPKETPHVQTQEVNPDLAELLGWQIAEGWENPKTNQFGLQKQDREVFHHIINLYEKLGYNTYAKPMWREDNDCWISSIGCKEYRQQLENELNYDTWGNNASEKKIPEGIMNAQPEAKRRFLEVFIGTESWFSDNERIMEFSTASKTIRKQIRSLLREFGLAVNFKEKEVEGTTYHRFTLGSTQLEEYAEKIGMGIEKEMPDMDSKTNPNGNGLPVSHHFKELNEENIPTGLKAVYSHGTQEPSAEKLQESVTYLTDLVNLSEDEMKSRRGLTKKQKQAIQEKEDFIREKIELFEDLLQKEVWWVEIEDIKTVEYDDYIYDFHVPETHNFVAEDMMVHNTLSSIGTALELRRQDLLKGNEEILIVVPSVLKREWAEEIEDFTDADYTVIDGKPDERPDQWNDDSFFKIVNYALLDYDDEPYDENWGAIIIDEATFIKNHKSQRTKNVKKLKAERRYALSGTPIENGLSDMFNIYEFLDPDFFVDYWHFKKRYLQTEKRSMRDREWEETVGTRNVSEFKSKCEPIMFRRTKKDVKDQLPPISTKKIFVDMEQPQWKEYKRIKQDMYDRIEEEEDLAGHIQYLHMLCNSTELINQADRTDVVPFGDLEPAHPKIDELKKLMKQIKQQDGKALIFTQWSSMVELIEEELYMDGDFDDDEINPVFLTGESSEQERNQGVEKFKGGRDFLVSTDIFKYGVNLQHANFVIHVDSLWNPAVMDQRRDRIYRIGQEHNHVTEIFLLTNDTIEEQVEDKMAKKRELQDEVVEDLNDLDPEDWIELA